VLVSKVFHVKHLGFILSFQNVKIIFAVKNAHSWQQEKVGVPAREAGEGARGRWKQASVIFLLQVHGMKV